MPTKNSKSKSSKKISSKNAKKRKTHSEESDAKGRPRLMEGEERRVHEEIIEQRIGGTVIPTQEKIIERRGEDTVMPTQEEIIERSRRKGGGAPPTSEAYARALKQWQELPGSVSRPPTDVIVPTQKRQESKDTPNTSERIDNDTDMGEQ
jgi:hypothetical protein